VRGAPWQRQPNSCASRPTKPSGGREWPRMQKSLKAFWTWQRPIARQADVLKG